MEGADGPGHTAGVYECSKRPFLVQVARFDCSLKDLLNIEAHSPLCSATRNRKETNRKESVVMVQKQSAFL